MHCPARQHPPVAGRRFAINRHPGVKHSGTTSENGSQLTVVAGIQSPHDERLPVPPDSSSSLDKQASSSSLDGWLPFPRQMPPSALRPAVFSRRLRRICCPQALTSPPGSAKRERVPDLAQQRSQPRAETVQIMGNTAPDHRLDVMVNFTKDSIHEPFIIVRIVQFQIVVITGEKIRLLLPGRQALPP